METSRNVPGLVSRWYIYIITTRAITKRSVGEACRKTNVFHGPLDRINIRDFSPGLFLPWVHMDAPQEKSGFLLTSKEPCLFSRKTCLASARFYPAHTLSFPFFLPFSHARFRFYRRNLIVGETTPPHAYDVAYVGSPSSCENANIHRESIVHRSNW